MTIIIPCETIVRMAALLPVPGADVEPIFNTMRFDNGKLIVTNRKFGAVEQIESDFEGIWHVAVPDTLLAQCKVEAQFGGSLTIVPNQTLTWTTARTTMGYDAQGNIGVYPTEPTIFDRWHEKMVQPALTPATAPNGTMVVEAGPLAALAAASPSGVIAFESLIDSRRTTIVRDAMDHRWVGFFHPRMNDGMFYPPASVPTWLRAE